MLQSTETKVLVEAGNFCWLISYGGNQLPLVGMAGTCADDTNVLETGEKEKDC